MQRFVFLFFLLFPSVFIMGQTTDSLDRNQLEYYAPVKYTAEEVSAPKKKLDFSLSIGSSFGFSPGNYYAPSLFVAPGLRYDLTPRFTLSGGLYVQQTRLYPMSYSDENTMLPVTRAFFYARGDYLLTPKLRVNGTVFTNINQFPASGEQVQQNAMNNIEAMELGLEYKFTNSFSVGLQMRVQNGGHRYYYDPFSPYSGGNFWFDPY